MNDETMASASNRATAEALTRTTRLLNLAPLAAAELHTTPFEYLLAENFVRDEYQDAVVRDFPKITAKGSFPLSQLSFGPAFRQLTDELLGPEFAAAVASKFGLDLSPYPTMITVRGWSARSDGQLHTDSKDKLITVLLYLNLEWDGNGGRLRLLRSNNVDDYAAEVSPAMGNLVIFKRSDRSWHGFPAYEGKRLSLQMNWVKSDTYARRERFRHRISSVLKGLVGSAGY
jgi:SM-20-related protein